MAGPVRFLQSKDVQVGGNKRAIYTTVCRTAFLLDAQGVQHRHGATLVRARGATVAQALLDANTPCLTSPLQVRVRAAAVPPECNFTFAYTDPKQDYDVSYHMETSGVVEAGITEVRGGGAQVAIRSCLEHHMAWVPKRACMR